MKYIAPKNNKTIKISKDFTDKVVFIDSFKEDKDCIKISDLKHKDMDEIIIYSPKYFKEIYVSLTLHVKKEKLKFYLLSGMYTKNLYIAKYFYKVVEQVASLKIYLKNISKKSETSKVRDSLGDYCVGNGIDIGFGGDPIKKTAVTIDLLNPYASYKTHPLNFRGSGDNLYWFKDGVLDYVYSSHLLEDLKDTKEVLEEWLRVLKPGGKLVLFLPDEQKYREYCASLGKPPNHHHIHENFSLAYVESLIKDRKELKILHKKSLSHIYSFELVIQKEFHEDIDN